MLDAREAFKVGFLARCVEAGYSTEQTLSLVKQAAEKLAGLLGDASMAASTGLRGLSSLIPLAVVAPPIVGGLGGLAAAKLSDIDEDSTVDELKNRETLDAYRTETARLKRQKAVRDYSRARQSGFSRY